MKEQYLGKRRHLAQRKFFLPLCCSLAVFSVIIAAFVWYTPLYQPSYSPVEPLPVPYFVQPSEDKINLNTAPVEEMTLLPGIGETRARAIAEYRKLSGPFKGLDDFADVPGIGPKTIDAIRDIVCFSTN